MRFFDYLSEEYFLTKKILYHGEETLVTFFKNPGHKEIAEACRPKNECRLMIDVDNRDLYIWSYKFLHEAAAEFLRSKGVSNRHPDPDNRFLWGGGRNENGKLELIYLDIKAKGKSQDDLQKLQDDTEFTKRWFTSQSSIEDMIDRAVWEVVKSKLGLSLLAEEYFTSTRRWPNDDTQVTIFKNPSAKEIREAADEFNTGGVRFLIDWKDKSFYIWTDEYLHQDACPILKKEGVKCTYPSRKNEYVWGAGSVSGNKIKISYVEIYSPKKADDVDKLIKDTAFVYKWLDDNGQELREYLTTFRNYY